MWRKFSTLVIGEQNSLGALQTATYHAVAAGGRFSGPVDIHVLGSRQAAEQASKITGVNKVLFQSADLPLSSEVIAPHVVQAFQAGGYKQIIAGASFFGKDLIPRIAGELGVQPISEVTLIEDDEETFLRPIYAGNAFARILVQYSPKVMTVRTTAFINPGSDNSASIEDVNFDLVIGKLEILGEEIAKSERPELGSAKIIVSGGRGLKEKGNFKLVEDLADVLGAAVGATRAIVDADYCSNDL